MQILICRFIGDYDLTKLYLLHFFPATGNIVNVACADSITKSFVICVDTNFQLCFYGFDEFILPNKTFTIPDVCDLFHAEKYR